MRRHFTDTNSLFLILPTTNKHTYKNRISLIRRQTIVVFFSQLTNEQGDINKIISRKIIKNNEKSL